MDKQIKEINEEIKKAIQRIENIWKKYDELREKYKRKEQECEMWKNLTIDNGAVALKYQQQLDQLKAENEELKAGLKQIQEQFGIEILYCKTTGESTFRSTEILKLKKALNEIKEIAQSNIDCKEFMAIQCMLMGSADDKNEVLQQILNKISEVENEN